MQIAEKTVMVTGANRGVGQALVKEALQFTDLDVIQKQLDVNLLGLLKVTQAFLPLLIRSKGTVVNILSVTSIAPVPVLPGYSISKAAALSLTQSLRALLARQEVGVHGVILGGVDTDMSRDYDGPKVSPESAAAGIFDGLEKGEEDIFPDPTSRPIADG
jgi:NAD(P)-dependent dehydrogenase (short-subunit alcohol dehydrogenase family)